VIFTLSDKTDWIYNKAELIARAAGSSISSNQVETLVIIVSGDIANKGYKEGVKKSV